MSTDTRRPSTLAAPETPAPDWTRAACARREDDLFFPLGDTTAARTQTDKAKLICARCPITRQCLSWALATGQDQGVWGGLTERERRAVHRRRTTEWGRTRHVAERMYAERLGEFTALLDRGLQPPAIATAMGTNVQTVNRVMERIEAAQAAGETIAA